MKKRFILIAIGLLQIFIVTAQKKNAEESLQHLYSKFPQEKVILSFSKKDYLAGETVFFKAYVLTVYEPSDISNNLYVELYDKNKTLLDKDILPIYKGAGEGSFVLPANMAEDVYYIRAYTHWMLNFNNSFQYFQSIKVYNPYSSYKLTPKPTQWTAAVFPESNSIIEGISTKVAVRLSSTGSLPQSWQGILFEKNNTKPVSTFNSYNKEVGAFSFLPDGEKQYYVRITDNEGLTKEVNLPQVKKEGINLQIKNSTGKVAYRIYFKSNPLKGAGYKLLATIHDQLVFTAVIKKPLELINGFIDTKDLPTGILNLTLLDENENVVAERLSFIDPQQLKIATPKLLLDTFSLSAKAINNWVLEPDSITWYTYAAQVQDASFPGPTNFLSSVFLTSDFMAPIDNPSWYLEDVTNNKVDALDALLITEKWQRFHWKDIVENKFPSITFLPDKYLSFKGTVSRNKKMEAIKDLNLIFQAKDSSLQFIQTVIDSSNHFYLENISFVDTVKVLFQLNSKKFAAKNIKIDFEQLNKFHPLKIDLPVSNYTITLRKKSDSLPSHISRSADALSNVQLINEKYKMMQEVVIRYQKRSATESLDDKLSTGFFKTKDAIIFDFINDQQASAMGYSNILQWMQGRVPGLYLTNINGVLTPTMRGSTPALFIDEFKIDPDQLNGFNISDIAMIKVIRGVFMGVSFGSNGAIAIYTKRGDLGSRSFTSDLPSNFLRGYKKQPQFFIPDYSSSLYKDFDDKREILYRQTLLVPDTSMQSRIRFNNNALSNAYRLIITGFTSDGKPVYYDKIIDAKKEP